MNEIKFHSSDEALKYLISVRDLEGSCGSVSGRAAADGELGLSPDGDAFGPDVTDRINARLDLEEVVKMGLDWRYRTVLDLFLDAECVRPSVELPDGTVRTGAHAAVVEWARCTPRHGHWLIDKMLRLVDRSLWRMGYLHENPVGVADNDTAVRASDNDGWVRATRNVPTRDDVDGFDPVLAAGYYTQEELMEMGYDSEE